MADKPDPEIGLLALAAHEIQGPLRRIEAYADRLADPDPAEVARAAAVILREAARARRLAADVIAWAKIDATDAVAEPVRLDLLVTAVADDWAAGAELADITLDLEPTTVPADPALVRPLVSNLLENALVHRKPETRATITVTLRAEDSRAVLAVADNGVGFAGNGAALFRPFHRAGSDRPGSGLGLAIAGAAAERLGWTLTAEGRPGDGALFRMEIRG
ncbi:sensor histidine kinase [Chthonobacter albigriseus]|uniref:sensor histidine kinase n=1 Tax=Chthonobacter albigriseus TaxID=1683161 RepID=UPI0015EEC08B|nr:HAMP domain-containing sensor histidine kinase [Chthonobacter albigriseus]